MKDLLFIINPAAGKGAARHLLQPIHERMAASDYRYDVKICPRKGEIEALTHEAIEEGYRQIVAVGGDGTLTEMIQSLYASDAADLKAGIIPCGTGNDFSRMLYKNNDPLSALEAILVGKTKLVDVLDCNGIKCINVSAMGIDGQIVRDTDRIKKLIPGPAAYLISTLKALLLYTAKETQIQLDDLVLERRTLIVAIGNGQFVGGGMQITPKAEIDDGIMDVCIVNHVSKPRLISLFPTIFKGKHLEVKEVEYYRGKEVWVKAIDKALYLNVDGNLVGTTPVHITLAPKKLSFFCE